MFRRVIVCLIMLLPWSFQSSRAEDKPEKKESTTVIGTDFQLQAIVESLPTPLDLAWNEACADPDTCQDTCDWVSRDDRSGGPIPTKNIKQWNAIYFHPYDRPYRDEWDRAAVCDDGTRVESWIGWTVYNNQAWMASRQGGNGSSVRGLAPRNPTRTYSAFNRTYTMRHVFHVGSQHGASFYDGVNYDNVFSELVARGWTGSQPGSKRSYGRRRRETLQPRGMYWVVAATPSRIWR